LIAIKLTNIPSFIKVFQADGTTEVAVNETLTLAQLQGLTYQTIANANGSGDVTWTVQDSGGTVNGGVDTLTDSVTITVDPVNDAPSFTLSDPPAVEEDAGPIMVTGFVTNISAGPSNESTQTVSFTVTVTNGNLTFTSDPAIDASGNLTYTVATGSSGTATVSVVLTDSGLGTSPDVNVSGAQMFTITVNAGNNEGEGESAGFSANDLALLWYLTNPEGTPGSLEVSDADWVTAVDQAMAQLG
jgi:hypothetical protein